MTQLEQELTQTLTQMRAMHEQELNAYENSLKKIAKELGESYKKHMSETEQNKKQEDGSLLEYFKMLTEQNEQIISLLKTPPKAETISERLQPILQDFFHGLENKLIASNHELIEAMEYSLKNLKRQ